MSPSIFTHFGKVKIPDDRIHHHQPVRAIESRPMENNLSELISQCLKDHNVNSDDVYKITADIMIRLPGVSKLTDMKSRLDILFQYERSYLELVKEFKEEIKFAGSIQEDLRKERAKFFSETLKDVSSTLKESQVEPGVAAVWLKDLVGSYTKSLDLSSALIEERSIDKASEIRDSARGVARSVETDGNS